MGPPFKNVPKLAVFLPCGQNEEMASGLRSSAVLKLTYLRVCADRVSNLFPCRKRALLPDIRTVVLRNRGLATPPCRDLLIPCGIRHILLPCRPSVVRLIRHLRDREAMVYDRGRNYPFIQCVSDCDLENAFRSQIVQRKGPILAVHNYCGPRILIPILHNALNSCRLRKLGFEAVDPGPNITQWFENLI